ncbi:hypothetical protein [Pseudoneobacillus sp. C159]
MKYFKIILVMFLSIFIIHFLSLESHVVSADDDFTKRYGGEQRDDHHDEEGPYKDIGKTIGWGTIIAMSAAGTIFPIRKSLKWMMTNYPNLKKLLISISKFFGKYHSFIGLLALIFGIFHGVTMYISEGKLESEGIIGLGSLIFMMVAAIFGLALSKNIKVKRLRTSHTILMAIALFIGFIHIFSS